MAGFILDTKVFNALLDGQLDQSCLGGRTIYAAHTQRDELANTEALERKEQLLATFNALAPEGIATSSAVWDVSPWDMAKWSASDGLYEVLLQGIRAADGEDRNKKKVAAENQIRDALLGETAIRNGLTLVTNDKGLTEAVRQNGGTVMALAEFQRLNE